MSNPTGKRSANTLQHLIQTRVRESTAKKLLSKVTRLGYSEAAYVRRLIMVDLGEISKDEG